MIHIACQIEGFSPGGPVNGGRDLAATWDDILWSAVTVGRPNRGYVFQHGGSSVYEALFRLSIIKMALTETGIKAVRLKRTNAFKTLDPTEKGAVNYFIGMTFCKLLAATVLDVPWVMHLDVFGPQVTAVLTGRSRPDLVGHKLNDPTRWSAFECKGRMVAPDATTKSKAKEQAGRIAGVNGHACEYHIGSITYFKDEKLNIYWVDPPVAEKNKIGLSFNPEYLKHYYGPVVSLAIASDKSSFLSGDGVKISQADIEISVHKGLAALLVGEKWGAAYDLACSLSRDFSDQGFQSDGLRIVAGDSWG